VQGWSPVTSLPAGRYSKKASEVVQSGPSSAPSVWGEGPAPKPSSPEVARANSGISPVVRRRARSLRARQKLSVEKNACRSDEFSEPLAEARVQDCVGYPTQGARLLTKDPTLCGTAPKTPRDAELVALRWTCSSMFHRWEAPSG
jgi:hypothetical protein